MILPSADELVQVLGPFAAFAVAMFDRTGLPLLVGTVCVAVGAVGGPFAPTIALACAGMVVGDLALYELGRQGKKRAALAKRLLRPLLPLRATARAILRKHPYSALAFGRYVAGAGYLIPFLAGSGQMKRGRVYAILVVASVVYVIPWGVLAFKLGENFDTVMSSIGNVVGWAGLAGLLAAGAAFFVFRVRRRARKATLRARRHARETLASEAGPASVPGAERAPERSRPDLSRP